MQSKKDWSAFAVFDGLCTLDKSRFRASDQGVRNDSATFCEWIWNLGQDPVAYGIPNDCELAVRKLIKLFFPVEWTSPSNSDKKQVKPPHFPNVRTQSIPGKNELDGDPVLVPFGDTQKGIPINDGPSALGYIFSVANQPKSTSPVQRTWDNYVIPLAALYSRCLYLAYVHTRDPQNEKNWRLTPSQVPMTTNAIYYMNHQSRLRVLLGSTYVTDSILGSDTDKKQKTQMMNTWRRRELLEPGLAYYDPTRVLPPGDYVLPPILEKEAARAIAFLLLGTNLGVHDPPGNPINWHPIDLNKAEVVFNTTSAAWITVWLNEKKEPILPQLRTSIWGMERINGTWPAELRAKLLQVVRLRWSTKYDRDSEDVAAAFTRVIRILFVPHMFRLTPAGVINADDEITEQIPLFQATADGIAQTLWTDHRDAILTMLDNLRRWIDTHDSNLKIAGPHIQRYGRCAETLPLGSLMPTFCSDRVLPATSIPKHIPHPPPAPQSPSMMYGFAMGARHFTSGRLYNGVKSIDLATEFSSETLNSIHEGVAEGMLYRLPCENCMSLLPQLDVPAAVGTDYHTLLKELYSGAVK